MSKPATLRRQAPTEAMAYARSIRVSPRKLNLVGRLIYGMPVAKALVQLQFSPKAIAKDVRQLLLSAIANAENNHNLDIDRLVVSEVVVGKGIVMKRFTARARGRAARIEKPFSNMRIVVREQQEE